MFIVTYRNIFFALTGALVLASLVAVAIFGLPLGIDFTGGTLVQVGYSGQRTDATAVTAALDEAGIRGYSLRESGGSGYILRAPALSDAQRGELAAMFSSEAGTARIEQLSEVGPTVGMELRNKAFIAVAAVMLCILLFIAFAFRKVSQPVSSWLYGLIALVTLLHDVVVPLGFFALLAYLTGAQVDTLFVTAMLTILGYSVHDTIVVFDRVRENLRLNHERNRKEPFEETAGHALRQTIARSVNTSFTTLLALAALYFLGPASTQVFALTLLVGIIAGTYSSIALATPLLVVAEARWGRSSGQKRK